MKTKFILVHSTGGDPEETFYPWLKTKLEEKGHEVLIPEFPTPEGQNLEAWMAAFEPYMDKIDENTVFLGRSIGPAFILRVLEKIDVKVKAAFLFCGFVSDLGMVEFTNLIDTFIGKSADSFDWGKIKKNCSKFYVYQSDDDPYVSVEKGKELAEKLGVDMILEHGKEHFWQDEFLPLITDIEELLKEG